MKTKNELLFLLEPDPTFWATVDIPMAGGKKKSLELEFAYKDRDEYREFFDQAKGKTDIEALPGIVLGWRNANLPFSVENLGKLLVKFPQAGGAIVSTYRDEIFGAEEKN